jgi:serine/threonine protein kinase
MKLGLKQRLPMHTSEAKPGDVVGSRYELVAVIGQGGMGRVWQAKDTRLDRVIAVKEVMLPTMSPAQHDLRLKQAEREGKNAAALADHPNIVTVYDVVVEEGSPWIIMQLVRGRSLHSILQDPDGRGIIDDKDPLLTPLPEGRVALITEAMLAALDSLHKAGIVHRDVKPHNIMLSDDGRVLLTDFGIAKSHADTTMTAPGAFTGTLAYIAPERAEGEPGSPASDYFSLGVTLFEAVEGYSPFAKKDSWTGTLTAILTKPLPPMRLAGKLAPLIEALTLKSPEQRPGAQQALALLKGGTPARPRSASPAKENVTEQLPPHLRAPEEKLPTVPKQVPWSIPLASQNPVNDRPRKLPWQTATIQRSSGAPRPQIAGVPHQPTGQDHPARLRIGSRLIAATGATMGFALAAAFVLITSPTQHRHSSNETTTSSPDTTACQIARQANDLANKSTTSGGVYEGTAYDLYAASLRKAANTAKDPVLAAELRKASDDEATLSGDVLKGTWSSTFAGQSYTDNNTWLDDCKNRGA